MKKISAGISPIHVAFLAADDAAISGLTWGFVVFAKAEITNPPVDRRQSMLLLPSVIDLLEGLTAFLSDHRDKQFIFESHNGSCCVKFFRKQAMFAVYAGHETSETNRIANVTESGLVAAINSALDSLDKRCADPDRQALLPSDMDEIETLLLADYKAASDRWRDAWN